MLKVNWKVKSTIHGIVNLTIILSLFVFVGACLWLLIPSWWLWLISMPIWGFGVMFIGHRIAPLFTNGLIEAIFKTQKAEEAGKEHR